MKPNLLIMAAGMGSRYGGLKQVDPIGPGGEAIIDYSMYDAREAGFKKVILIIREELTPHFEHYLNLKDLQVELAYQPHPSQLNPERTKPWGTGQAVLAAGEYIDGPFAVINADDFYGRKSFEKAYQLLKGEAAHALVAYPLAATLPDSGSVSRAICQHQHGTLQSIREVLKIWQENGQILSEDNGTVQPLDGNQLVSMNFWCFQQPVLQEFQQGFDDFLASERHSERAEFLIPDVVQNLLQAGQKVTIEQAEEPWFGITNPDDKALAQKAIRSMIEIGKYPPHLWK